MLRKLDCEECGEGSPVVTDVSEGTSDGGPPFSFRPARDMRPGLPGLLPTKSHSSLWLDYLAPAIRIVGVWKVRLLTTEQIRSLVAVV